MSHFTKVRTELRKREHLIEACETLGYVVEEESIVRGWRGQVTEAEIVVRQDNGYDIGFVRSAEGEPYEIVADWMGTGITSEEFGRRVQREYAAIGAIAGAKRAGWRNIKRVEEADGTILITGTRA